MIVAATGRSLFLPLNNDAEMEQLLLLTRVEHKLSLEGCSKIQGERRLMDDCSSSYVIRCVNRRQSLISVVEETLYFISSAIIRFGLGRGTNMRN